ncbi:MAG: 16S rRNA (uracil(1498)-N(3))-methyltransferase [bacterium]
MKPDTRLSRAYIPDSALSEGETLALGREARHHLVNVLRLKPGKRLLAFNGTEEKEALAILRNADRKSASIEIVEVYDTHRESALKIELIQGIGKSDHMDFAIQKAVELGVSHLTPIHTERTQGRLGGERLDKKMAHWRTIVINACQQSGRCLTPSLALPQSLPETLSKSQSPDHKTLILSPEAGQPLAGALASRPSSLSLLVGPEGGFTAEEVALSLALNAEAVSLGPRILRMETAAVTAIACCQQLAGDI